MKNKTSLTLLFFIVLLDLIGFGIVIPLINIYGLHYGADGVQLAVLASAYSTMQFLFAPFWGALSDKIGRRPVLLFSLFGSVISYTLFGLAQSYYLLLISRALAGVFAGNISAAQAYIADTTDRGSRTAAMGLIGAAFGIGFTLGPPLGGITAKWYGLSFPGFLAAFLSATTLCIAYFKLPESLSEENRQKGKLAYRLPILSHGLSVISGSLNLKVLIAVFFLATFAFSNFEQAFSPFLQESFNFSTDVAGYKAGLILMWLGIVGVVMQVYVIKKLLKFFNEWQLVNAGFMIQVLGFLVVPFFPTYESYFLFAVLIPIGGGLANPCLTSLLSLNAPSEMQGRVLGLAQGFGSLARIFGPACAIYTFTFMHALPFYIGSVLYFISALLILRTKREE